MSEAVYLRDDVSDQECHEDDCGHSVIVVPLGGVESKNITLFWSVVVEPRVDIHGGPKGSLQSGLDVLLVSQKGQQVGGFWGEEERVVLLL